MIPNSTKHTEKRTLTKVRRGFVQKKEEDDQHRIASPTTLSINDNNVYVLSSSTGLVEINRKIYSGPQYLNYHFNIAKSFIEDNSCSKAVTLALSPNHKSQAIPWEYTMKRLESFGDLELATWAHRVIKYNKNYTKLIDKFMRLHYCDDMFEVKSKKEQLAQISQDIENTCSYYKIVHCFSPDSTILREMSYSESFLTQMGHSIESFLTWTNKNGLPPLFDHQSSIYFQILKSVFEGSILSLGTVNRGEAFQTFLVDKKGVKKDVVVESVYLVEPSEDGILVTGYFILKESNHEMYLQIISEDSTAHFKQKKIKDGHDSEKMQTDENDQ